MTPERKLIEKQKELIEYLLKYIGGYEASSIIIRKYKYEITILESEIEQQPKGIDKDWIYEIMDKTNQFAKQLIEDHFNRHEL